MKLYVIGLGPGEQTQMTPKAMAAIGDSDVIAGYTVYIDLIKHLTEEKEILTTPMKQEVDRCRMAIEGMRIKGKIRFHGMQRRCRCLRNGRAYL